MKWTETEVKYNVEPGDVLIYPDEDPKGSDLILNVIEVKKTGPVGILFWVENGVSNFNTFTGPTWEYLECRRNNVHHFKNGSPQFAPLREYTQNPLLKVGDIVHIRSLLDNDFVVFVGEVTNTGIRANKVFRCRDAEFFGPPRGTYNYADCKLVSLIYRKEN